MNLLPIVERELRVSARRPGIYRTRCVCRGGDDGGMAAIAGG